MEELATVLAVWLSQATGRSVESILEDARRSQHMVKEIETPFGTIRLVAPELMDGACPPVFECGTIRIKDR